MIKTEFSRDQTRKGIDGGKVRKGKKEKREESLRGLWGKGKLSPQSGIKHSTGNRQSGPEEKKL